MGMMTNKNCQVMALNTTKYKIKVMVPPTPNVNLKARSRSTILKSEDTWKKNMNSEFS